LFELENEEKISVAEKEKTQHTAIWIKEKDVELFINVWNQKLIWKKYKEGDSAYCDDGILVNSGEYDGLKSEEARKKMTEWLEKNKIGSRKINYKLRDWLVSRQRYWGAPIPIIYCKKCGMVPVPEKDLPVLLPDDVDFNPTGESPLKYSQKFQDVKCPICGAKAERESDTMDTFVCSSWYYFRYSDPQNTKEFASKKNIQKWLPVDLYVGGAEHAVLHLLYSRFFTKALHSLGYIDFDEPFLKLRHQGIILAEDGRKMSKSLENVVNPDEVVKKFGADSLRMFEMFMGPLEDAKPWNTRGIIGIYRFLEKVYRLNVKIQISNDKSSSKSKIQNPKSNILLNKTIKKVGEDIEGLKFNTAISSLMILANELDGQEKISLIHYTLYLILLSPFAPHIAEELWSRLGYTESIFKQKWPEYDTSLIQDEELELIIQIGGKVRDKIKVKMDISEDEAKELARQSEKIKNFIGAKPIKKIIFVKNRLINIVI
jgi:leucyl-tRNA synthetase